jgi:hypothetical protein
VAVKTVEMQNMKTLCESLSSFFSETTQSKAHQLLEVASFDG